MQMAVKETRSLKACSGYSSSYCIWNQVCLVSHHWNRPDKCAPATCSEQIPFLQSGGRKQKEQRTEFSLLRYMIQGQFKQVLPIKAFVQFSSQWDSCCNLSHLLQGDWGSLAKYQVDSKFLCSLPFPLSRKTCLVLNSLLHWTKR